MRRSEFLRAVSDEFGARGGFLLSDLVLEGVGAMTASEAIDRGVPPREVWLALCEACDVPAHRRYGAGRLEPRKA